MPESFGHNPLQPFCVELAVLVDVDHLKRARAGISKGMGNTGGHHHDLTFAGFDGFAANLERHPAAADQKHFRIGMPVWFRPAADLFDVVGDYAEAGAALATLPFAGKALALS